jgi:UDP-N-acetylmuramoyl-tripeptide--D-alanyl-D-alanine ligase
MTPLWTTVAFVAATGGRVAGAPPVAITGLSIDTRTLQPGDAFFAIRGENRDGHEFVDSALKAGAALAVVREGRRAEPERLLIVPDDPLDALTRLASAARARADAKIVAVTGSVGKTGTKEMLRLALSEVGQTHAPVGSFNNQWGVPLTLARMPAATKFGIFEIGMNHPGEIRPLTRLVHPHVAIVTTVEPVHLAYFESEAAIAEAKAEIFEGLEPGGTAVLNRDNRWFELLSGRARERSARIVSFGGHQSADMHLDRVELGEDGSHIEARLFGKPLAYTLGAPGRHLVQNSLAVIAACDAAGAALAKVTRALEKFRAPRGRGERHTLAHKAGRFVLIDESYNANPTSMRAALKLLGQTSPEGRGRRIAVLGDMLELGDEAEAYHRGLAQPLQDASADLVFLVGPMMERLWQDLPNARRGAYAECAAKLEPILLETIGPGDVIMLKASLGTGLGPIVEAVKRRFAGPAE